MLARLGRKLLHIQGDGNCFFRALSYILNGTEDHHISVRATLVLFSELNAQCFEKYCTSGSFKEHLQCMKHETVFATQMEAHVAASCFQRTLYIYTQRSGNGEYYWERFDPLPPLTLQSLPNEYRIDLHPFMVHMELCHINRCHYDVITALSGEPCPYPPHRLTTVPYADLT